MTRASAGFRLAALAASVLALFALTALPAAARTSSPQEWGAAFCGGLSDWADHITASATEIDSALQATATTPDQAKQTIVAQIGAVADATGAFSATVKQAGTPDSTNGAAIQRTILAGVAGVRKKVRGMQALAASLPTTDATAFQTAVGALNQAFSTVSTPFDRAMTKVAKLDKGSSLSGELQKIKACKALSG